jgi:hypothetical protein
VTWVPLLQAIDRAAERVAKRVPEAATYLDNGRRALRHPRLDRRTVEVWGQMCSAAFPLFDALRAGTIAAYGDDGTGRLERIPPVEWSRLVPGPDSRAFVPRSLHQWRDVIVPAHQLADVLRPWGARPQPSPPVEIPAAESAPDEQRVATVPAPAPAAVEASHEPKPVGRPNWRHKIVEIARQRRAEGAALAERTREVVALARLANVSRSLADKAYRQAFGPERKGSG